jgi:hypothetical protein
MKGVRRIEKAMEMAPTTPSKITVGVGMKLTPLSGWWQLTALWGIRVNEIIRMEHDHSPM